MKKFLLFFLSFALFAEEAKIINDDKIENYAFTQYKPTYFIFGDKQDQVKVQTSFKYQIYSKIPLYFGFSSQMFWQLYDSPNSSPFREINYNPEIFYRLNINSLTFRYIQFIPWEHKSNGRQTSPEDRTLDKSGIMIANEFAIWKLLFASYAKFYYLYNIGSQNKDIKNYIGFSEYRFSLRLKNSSGEWIDKEEISIKLIIGDDIRKTGQEYGIKFRTLIKHFNPYIYFQIWNGYGENLLDYNIYSTAYRIGFIFEI